MNSPQDSTRIPVGLNRSISPASLDPEATVTKHKAKSSKPTYQRPNRKSHGSNTAVFASFTALPSKAIQRILWSVDANTFASLCLLNRRWRKESQQVELYAHHLSRCPSYALSNSLITGPFRQRDLLRLKSKFAAEVRRNLFDAYAQPRRTFINLISINANSSAAFPTGEAFRFDFSPNGRMVLALSSSRIYVLDATSDSISVIRALKTLRRPLSASITDDGSLLAVLSSRHQVNIYALTSQGVQHLQVIALDHPPKIIAIAHEGTVLAASFETAIEVFSLAANSLTTDRRAVRSESVDTLNFSGDGSMLIGSSLNLENPNAVVISAPFYTENDPDLSPREVHSRMWTTQILFPQISSVCSHVALLPGHTEGDAYWLFAYDHSLMSFRAVRTDDTRAGVVYFLSPPGFDRFDTPSPTIAPSASACGTLTVAGFEGGGLWLYGVPERLDLTPDMGAVVERNEQRTRDRLPLTSATGSVEPLMAYSPSNTASDQSIEDDPLAGKVDWRQSLFVKCRNLYGMPGQTAAKWVEQPEGISSVSTKRLIVVAPGGVSPVEDALGDESLPVDGSRMCVLDFDYAPSVPEDRVIIIEVGEEEPELLTEQTGSLANQVAMERRRTIRAIPTSDSSRMLLGRSVTSVSPPSSLLSGEAFRRGSVSSPSSPTEESKGSRLYATNSLQRSVTASGFRHAIYPPRPPLGSFQNADQNQFHHTTHRLNRPGSNGSWESPPPPYSGRNSSSHSVQHPTYGNTLSSQQQMSATLSPAQETTMTGVAQQPLRSYRPFSTGGSPAHLDAVMTSSATPNNDAISQYDELMLAARSRGPSEASLDTVTELSSNHQRSGPTNKSLNSWIPDGNISAGARPATHHGFTPYSQHDRSTPEPMLPFSPPNESNSNRNRRNISLGAPVSANRISLTGTNLQNRLNHPVPPIPEQLQQSTDVVDAEHERFMAVNAQAGHVAKEDIPLPSMPTADQMARLHRRTSQSELARPPSLINPRFVHKTPAGGAPASPPRGAWGATGIPGSPTFQQARNVPGGFSRSRSSSQGNQTSSLASASAPNLLAQRPRYGRLDTIDSITDANRPQEYRTGVRSRAHSMTQVLPAANAEQSAYHETSSTGAVPIFGKHGKRGRKKKEETSKRGSKCAIM